VDTVLLSRIQFALTVGFHFIYPPLTIGLAWLIFLIMTLYLRTNDAAYKAMARFWIGLFALSFAMGVASGITMEFQFGTNWAAYSRFVGDIFGAPLAAEGILAFFLESSFLGLLIFGWNRVSKKTLWISSLLVALGSTLSAFWIIAANSWQHTPAGYQIVNGRAELTDFWAAIFNHSTMQRFIHTVNGALITGSMFMLGISAYHLLKKQHQIVMEKSFKIALVFLVITAWFQLGFGHAHGIQMWRYQPIKLAAFEGLFETQKAAPFLAFGIPNAETGKVDYEIHIPGFLSLMLSGKSDTEVQGLNDFPKDEWPPVRITFFNFRLMFILGVYFIGLGSLGILLLRLKKLYNNRFYLRLALLSVPLPFLANEFGWIATEVGRQPWVVYKLLKTQDAVSPTVSAGQILFSIIMFGLIYTLLFAAWIFLLRMKVKQGPELVRSVAGREAGS